MGIGRTGLRWARSALLAALAASGCDEDAQEAPDAAAGSPDAAVGSPDAAEGSPDAGGSVCAPPKLGRDAEWTIERAAEIARDAPPGALMEVDIGVGRRPRPPGEVWRNGVDPQAEAWANEVIPELVARAEQIGGHEITRSTFAHGWVIVAIPPARVREVPCWPNVGHLWPVSTYYDVVPPPWDTAGLGTHECPVIEGGCPPHCEPVPALEVAEEGCRRLDAAYCVWGVLAGHQEAECFLRVRDGTLFEITHPGRPLDGRATGWRLCDEAEYRRFTGWRAGSGCAE